MKNKPNDRWIFWFAILVLSILITDAAFGLPPKHKQVGTALIDLGYKHSAWRVYTVNGISESFTVTEFNPIYRKDWRRYGYDCANGIFGDTNRDTRKCGKFARPYLTEEVSILVITKVIRLKDNPLGILNNTNYTPSDRDIKDIMMSYDPYTRRFIYIELFMDLYSKITDPAIQSTGVLEYELAPTFTVKPE